MEDDRIVEISEDIRNISKEERDRRIAILKEVGRREAKGCLNRQPFFSISALVSWNALGSKFSATHLDIYYQI